MVGSEDSQVTPVVPRAWGVATPARGSRSEELVTRRLTPRGVDPTKATLLDEGSEDPTPITAVRDLRTHDTPTGPADELGFDRPLFDLEDPLETLPDTDKMQSAPPALEQAQRELLAEEAQQRRALAGPLPLPALPGLMEDEEDFETAVFESRQDAASDAVGRVADATSESTPTRELRPGRRNTPASTLPVPAAASSALGERRTGPHPLSASPGRYRARGKSGEVPTEGVARSSAIGEGGPPKPMGLTFEPVTGAAAVARPARSPAPRRLQAAAAAQPVFPASSIDIPPPPEALVTRRGWTHWARWLGLAIALGLALGIGMGFAIKKWQRGTPQRGVDQAVPAAAPTSPPPTAP